MKAGLEESGKPVSSPELIHRALKKIRPDSPDVTRAAKRVELAKKNLVKITEVEEKNIGLEKESVKTDKSYLCDVHKCRKSSSDTLKKSAKNSPLKSDDVNGKYGGEDEKGEGGRENEVEPGNNRRESLGAISKTQKRWGIMFVTQYTIININRPFFYN